MNIRSLQNAPGPRRGLTFMLALGAVAGILLWAKLRLVSNMPRSVYAEPRQVDSKLDAKDDGTQAGRSIDAPTAEEVFEATEAKNQQQSAGQQPFDEKATNGEPSSSSVPDAQPPGSESSPR